MSACTFNFVATAVASYTASTASTADTAVASF
jgi:hypothetical protein